MDNQITPTDYLVTKENWAVVADVFVQQNIPTSAHTRVVNGVGTTVGLSVGDSERRVVAFWGDTLRHEPNGSFSVWRLSRVEPERTLTWSTVDPDENLANEAFADEMAEAERLATCSCKDRKPGEYTLSIDCGSIDVRHTPCGKRPWFMFNDMTDYVSMDEGKVEVEEVAGCGGYPCFGGSCDCGPEITLTLPGGK